MKKYTRLSLMQIATYFGNKNHATVLAGIKHLNNLSDIDKIVRKQIMELDKVIRYKSKSSVKNVDMNKDFYFIDFNDVVSIKFGVHKGIMLTGFDDHEIENLKKYLVGHVEVREHHNTGIYILEQNNTNYGTSKREEA